MGCLKLTYDQNFPLLKVTHSDFSAKEKKMNRFFISEEKSSAGKYRYSFNGCEKDDEVKGNGNHLDFGNFGYDTRLGRRWNIDPVVKSHESPYATFANNPVWFADVNGMDTLKMHLKEIKGPNDKEFILFQVSFSHIKEGIERVVSIESQMHLALPRAEYNKKGNKLTDGVDYSLIWKTGKNMSEWYSTAWNENVLNLEDDNQFIHPASEISQSVGCFLPCKYPEYRQVDSYVDENGKKQPIMVYMTGNSPGSDQVRDY